MLWNPLSKEIKNTTIGTFKKHLKYEPKKINAISFTKGTGQFLKKDSDFIYFNFNRNNGNRLNVFTLVL